MRYEVEHLKFKFLGLLSFLYLTIFLVSTATVYKLVVGPFLQPAPPYIFLLTYVIIDFVWSGTIAVWLRSYINVHMLTKWKVLMKEGCYFWFRSIMSGDRRYCVRTDYYAKSAVAFQQRK
jgi:hypothetical protein